MSTIANPSPAAATSSWNFSIRGLLVCLFGLSVGLSVFRQPKADWTEALLAAFGAWLVTGLFCQARDLWHALDRTPEAPQDARFALIFSLAWRIAVVFSLSGVYAFQISGNGSTLKPVMPDYSGYEVRSGVSAALWVLVILSACSLPTFDSSATETRVGRRIRNYAGVAVGFAWGLLIALNQLVIPVLVHIAVTGVELHSPTRWRGVAFYAFNDRTALYRQFEQAGSCAFALSLIIGLLLWQLSRRWNSSARRYLLIAVLAAFELQGGLVVWCARAFPAISPFLASQLFQFGLQVKLLAAMFIVLVATTVAYRFSRSEANEAASAGLRWRRRNVYHHEHLFVILLPTVALATQSLSNAIVTVAQEISNANALPGTNLNPGPIDVAVILGRISDSWREHSLCPCMHELDDAKSRHSDSP